MQNIKIPFDTNGNAQKYPNSNSIWKDNYEFEDKMTLTDIVRGRSAANFVVTGKDKRRYIMFMKDLFEACKQGTVSKGNIKGTFCFVKRGANYGITWVGK